MKRYSLVGRFALLSAAAMIVLGLGLGRLEANLIRHRGLENAQDSAEFVAHVGLQSQLTPLDIIQGLTPEEISDMDEAFREGLQDHRIARIKIWSPTGKIVYSDDHSLIGRTFPIEDELGDALKGKVSSDISSLDNAENVDERKFGQLFEVYLPLRFGNERPVGAFELYVPYKPIGAAIASDTRQLLLFTLVALLLLYAALFRIVSQASRRLDEQASELERRAERNEWLALNDTLTGLPNRTSFQRVLDDKVASGDPIAAVVMDLDRFKEINDTLGHEVGDAVLREAAERLTRFRGPVAAIARLGGDEFGLVVAGDVPPAETTVRSLSAAFTEPFQVQGISVEVMPSFGLAHARESGDDSRSVLRRAEIAMYEAKARASRVESYSDAMERSSTQRLVLAGELRRAIERGELRLRFQPKVLLPSGAVVGVEALVRWQHPTRGLLEPQEFIPVAESSGLIRQLTTWVLEQALPLQRRLADSGAATLTMSVNVSARSLSDPRLPEEVAREIATARVDPARVILEVTETSMVEEGEHVFRALDELTRMGVTLSVDDFGTGYSSLSYIQRLPVGEVKIDRGFVMGVENNPGNRAIVRAAIDVASVFDLAVVAEGVENETSAQILADLGCHAAQGFHFAQPMDEEELLRWLGTATVGLPFAS
ncbi:MAG TPA: bifunctional diguanylate cyclase/phosphodiesterase [Actinomycetota bacterium]|nr:bifunctional diguanylate cyclase/phosphodiesterase [Actinomycetota bacterium]